MAGTDHERVRFARQGRREAFDDLVERHGPAVLRLLSRLLTDREDAMDAWQDTFLSAYRSIGALRDPDRAGAWLMQIAANAARRRFRSRRARPEMGSFPDQGTIADPSTVDAPAAAAADARRAALADAVAALPDRQRQVLALRVDGGLSYREIADALGIREDNARANHYQALRSLRRALDPASAWTDSRAGGVAEARAGGAAEARAPSPTRVRGEEAT